jgi:hypothetical protein
MPLVHITKMMSALAPALVNHFSPLITQSWPSRTAWVRNRLGSEPPCGSVIIADELVADDFTAPAPELERYHYGWSVVACLPGAMGDPHTAATGAVLRPATLRRYAEQAGFSGAEILPLATENWRFYRLSR